MRATRLHEVLTKMLFLKPVSSYYCTFLRIFRFSTALCEHFLQNWDYLVEVRPPAGIFIQANVPKIWGN
jgi:hypothetical protein